MDNIVYVTSMVDHKVGIKIPDLGLKIVWEKRGARKPVPAEKLQMAMYNYGVEYMFTQGMLCLEKTPESEKIVDETIAEVIALTEKQKENLWKNATLVDFRIRVSELPYEQIKFLADWAVENDFTEYDKSKVIKELVGVDVISKIALKHVGDE